MNLKVKGKDRKGNYMYTGQISVMVNVFSDLQVGSMLLVIDDVFLICYWCMHPFLNHSLIKLNEN